MTYLRYLLLVYFVICAILGAVGSVRGLRKIRAARKYKNAIFAWTHRPHPGYEHELIPWIAVVVHMIAAILIGAIMLLMLLLARVDAGSIIIPPGLDLFLSIILVTFAAGTTGTHWGRTLFHPIAETIAGGAHSAVGEEGWLFAGRVFPWSAFSSFSVDPNEPVIYLWSASIPGTLANALEFDSMDDMLAVKGIVQGKLPYSSQPETEGVKKYAVPLLMTALCAPLVVLALLMALVPFGIGLFVDAVLMFLLMLGGSQLLRYLTGRSKPAAVEP